MIWKEGGKGWEFNFVACGVTRGRSAKRLVSFLEDMV